MSKKFKKAVKEKYGMEHEYIKTINFMAGFIDTEIKE